MTVNKKIKVARLSSNACIPKKATPEAAGLDLFAVSAQIVPGARVKKNRVSVGRALVQTGIAIAIPKGSVGRIGSRSGLSVNHNVEVGAGWIDPDYRGEILVELKNLGPTDFPVKRGMRIAQLFILRLGSAGVEVVRSLPASHRGKSGFGSTGI